MNDERRDRPHTGEVEGQGWRTPAAPDQEGDDVAGDDVAGHVGWGLERAHRSFAWGTLPRAGTVIAFGTDAPVSPPDPWPGISVASRRADPSWSGALGRALEPAQALGLVAALRAACHGQLLAAGEGLLGGALSSGRRADLVVVPVDALEGPVHSGGALASARSRLTLIDGEVVHRDADFDG